MKFTPVQQSIVREIKRLHARREPLNIPAVKRKHPKLIERIYTVRPFWGWKRALEAAALTYDAINTELLDHVDCKICGGDFGALDVHLLRKHGVSAEDYRNEYPEAETTSETLRAVIARNRLQKRPLLPRWEEVWTPEYVLDRTAELHRRNFPLNIHWVGEHDQSLTIKGREYFGSWDETLRRIGLDPKLIRLAQPTEHLTKEQVIARLKKQRKRPVRQTDDTPLANAARKHFGSWNAALRAAGIEPRLEKSRWFRATRPEIVAEIRRRKRAGGSLHSTPEVGAKWDRALRLRVEKLFGTWNRALRAAGIEPPKENSPWRKARKIDIVREIRRRHRAGESLATRKVERTKWGCPLVNRAKFLFGSWAGAIRTAGLELPPGLMSPWAKANRITIMNEIGRRKRVKKSIRYSDVHREPWGGPLVKRAEALFGSWKNALLAAGAELPAGAKSPWPDKNKSDIIVEIRRRNRGGAELRYSKIEAEHWGKPFLRRAKFLFGSWNAALHAAGINPRER